MAWADENAELRRVDEQIHRVRIARDDAKAHGNTILVEADDARLNGLLDMRLRLMAQRESAE